MSESRFYRISIGHSKVIRNRHQAESLYSPLHTLEHWSVKSKFGLDAKTSDYIYKHHIARLEDIYAHRRFEIKNPAKMLTQSPGAQLFGINGLKSSLQGTPGSRQRRERQWVGNHQKYRTLEDIQVLEHISAIVTHELTQTVLSVAQTSTRP